MSTHADRQRSARMLADLKHIPFQTALEEVFQWEDDQEKALLAETEDAHVALGDRSGLVIGHTAEGQPVYLDHRAAKVQNRAPGLAVFGDETRPLADALCISALEQDLTVGMLDPLFGGEAASDPAPPYPTTRIPFGPGCLDPFRWCHSSKAAMMAADFLEDTVMDSVSPEEREAAIEALGRSAENGASSLVEALGSSEAILDVMTARAAEDRMFAAVVGRVPGGDRFFVEPRQITYMPTVPPGYVQSRYPATTILLDDMPSLIMALRIALDVFSLPFGSVLVLDQILSLQPYSGWFTRSVSAVLQNARQANVLPVITSGNPGDLSGIEEHISRVLVMPMKSVTLVGALGWCGHEYSYGDDDTFGGPDTYPWMHKDILGRTGLIVGP